MNFFSMLGKINQLHFLIKSENTGSPDILAKRLSISRSTLYRIIEELKSYDAPINYSRDRMSFYYTKHYELELHCSIKVIDDEAELRRVIGGTFLSSVSFLRRKDNRFVYIS